MNSNRFFPLILIAGGVLYLVLSYANPDGGDTPAPPVANDVLGESYIAHRASFVARLSDEIETTFESDRDRETWWNERAERETRTDNAPIRNARAAALSAGDPEAVNAALRKLRDTLAKGMQ